MLMTELLAAIEECQKNRGLTDSEFARFLGIHYSYWSMIKSGRRPFGLKFLMVVAAKLPETHRLILDYLVEGGKLANHES